MLHYYSGKGYNTKCYTIIQGKARKPRRQKRRRKAKRPKRKLNQRKKPRKQRKNIEDGEKYIMYKL